MLRMQRWARFGWGGARTSQRRQRATRSRSSSSELQAASTHLVISGDRYDGRRLIKARSSRSSAGLGVDGWLRDADIAVDVATFSGFSGEEFQRVPLRLNTSAGDIHSFLATADTGDHLAGELSNAPDGQHKFTLEADNAGLRSCVLSASMAECRVAICR